METGNGNQDSKIEFAFNPSSRLLTVVFQSKNLTVNSYLKLEHQSNVLMRHEINFADLRAKKVRMAAILPTGASPKDIGVRLSPDSEETTVEFRASTSNTRIIDVGISAIKSNGHQIYGWVHDENEFLEEPILNRFQKREKSAAGSDSPNDVLWYRWDSNLFFFKAKFRKKLSEGNVLRIENLTGGSKSLRIPRSPRLGPRLWIPAIVSALRLRRIRKQYSNKRVWILGNGPSVLPEDLDMIPKEDVSFCFNRFYLSHNLHGHRSTFALSVDTGMLRDFGKEMISAYKGKVIFGSHPERTRHLHSGFLPIVLSKRHDNFLRSHGFFFSEGGSSPFVAIQIAIFLRANEIILYGMDYKFTTGALGVEEGKKVSREEGNHFIQNYRGGMPWYPPNWTNISASLMNSLVVATCDGTKIVNSSRVSEIPLIPRVNLEDCTDPFLG